MQGSHLSINGHSMFFTLWDGKRDNRNWYGIVKGKKSQPNFKNRIAGTKDIVIFIDFDNIEVDAAFFRNHGCAPFMSHSSGRMKGILYIESDGKYISNSCGMNTVKHVFGEEWFNKMDKQGMFNSYIHPDEWDRLSKMDIERHPVITDSRSWVMLPHADVTGNETMDSILTFALSHYRFDEGQIDIPVHFAGDTIGVDGSTVSRNIEKLKAGDWLLEVDSWYCKDFKAKTYALTEKAIKRAVELGVSLKYCLHGPADYIPDGEWWKRLLPQMSFFESFKEAFRWFESLPGCYARGKERLSKLRSAWRHHARNNGLDELCLA